MERKRVFRLSGILVTLGFLLLIPGVLLLVMMGLLGMFGIFGTGAAIHSGWETSRSNAVVQLQSVRGLPDSFVQVFQTNAVTAANQIESLPQDVQPPVKEIVRRYHIEIGASSAGGGVAAFFGGAIVFLGIIVAIPMIVGGFLLTMRKRVWRCMNCGFIFERA